MNTLNEKQQLIVDLLTNPQDKRIFLLKGEAGTGKSYTISHILNTYKGSVLLTATTNKAKNLLAHSTNNKVYTTHSALGFMISRNGEDMYLADINEPNIADLIIIDEYSMLPNKVWKKILQTPYKHILLVGDECQLRAIGEKANVEADIEVTLTEQMRQVKNNSLVSYLSKFREAIEAKRMFELYSHLPSCIKTYENFKEFATAYNECENSKRILAYSNRVIDTYNLNINNQTKYKLCDLLIIDKPLGLARNGDVVEVVDIKELDEYFKLDVLFEDRIYQIKTFKSKTAMNKYLSDLRISNPKEYLRELDRIYNPKHLYASTIHKAQGQTIDEVFIDVRDLYSQLTRTPSTWNNYNKPISVQEFLQLLYVAITRMRLKAHLFIGEVRNYKYLRKDKNGYKIK